MSGPISLFRCIFAAGIVLLVLLIGCDNSTEPNKYAPRITSQPVYEARAGELFSYVVTSAGYPDPTYALLESPDGMIINSETGEITWTPDSTAEFHNSVIVRLTNEKGTAVQRFLLQVAGLQIEGWETSSLFGQNISRARISDVVDSIEANVYPQINSLLIVRNGKLAYERYFHGRSRNSSENIYSASKSVTSCLMGIAIDRGIVANVDQFLYDYFPEYDSIGNWNPWKDSITIEHLITMTTGFELEGEYYDTWINNSGPDDWIKFYLDLPVVRRPGSAFNYESLCDRLAGHIIEREARVPLPTFAAENLFIPLEMRYYNWANWRPVTDAMLSGQLRLRAIDMGKIGQLYMDGGVWKSEQIVPADWVARSTTVNMAFYGYNWWSYLWSTPVGYYRVYYGFGNGGNAFYVLDALQMVVVFTGDYFLHPDVWDQQYDLMKQQIIPAAVEGSR